MRVSASAEGAKCETGNEIGPTSLAVANVSQTENWIFTNEEKGAGMKFWALLMMSCIIGSAAHARSASSETASFETAAAEAAVVWLEYVDSGNYAESWDHTSEFFQKVMPREQWEKAVAPLRESLGPVVSRQLKSAEFHRSLPVAPDGEYVVLQFETQFEKKAKAIETVTPKLETDGAWKVSGYYIN